MLAKLKSYLVLICLAQVLLIIFLIYRLNSQSKLNKINLKLVNYQLEAKLDSLKASYLLSTNLVLAQASALELSLGKTLTNHELEAITTKLYNLDTSKLTNDYQRALGSVKDYLKQRHLQDSLKAVKSASKK